MKSRSIYILFFISLTTLTAYAQPVKENKLKQQFPEAKVVFLEKKEHLNLDYQNKQWDIKRNVLEEMYYLDNVPAQQTIYYTGFEKITNLSAKTKSPIKKGRKVKYKEYPVQNIETKDVLDNSIFYSDHKQKKVTFPKIQSGAITHLSYTETTSEPRLLGSFYFGDYAPVLLGEFSVSFPKKIQITYKLLGENTDKIKFKKSNKNDITTYTWAVKDLQAVEIAGNAPSASYYVPHVAIYINSVESDGKEEKLLEDVNGLYRWYSQLIKNVNEKPAPELQKIVVELTQDVTDKEEKVKRIFQWVQKNIDYVAFEDGLGGFIPREAKDVCSKKYGDCKDMSSIIVEMLKMADVPAYFTWIGTRDRPYSYYDVPSPIVDNHMIAATQLNGKWVFLDATSNYQPFGLPTSMIQGKEALIGIDADSFHIHKVPIIDKETNTQHETITLNIKDKNLVGKATTQLNGYKKVFAEYSKLRADTDDITEFLNDFLRKGSNKFSITKATDKGFFDLNTPIDIDYEFEIPNYVKKASDKLYVNLQLSQKHKNNHIDTDKRKLSIEREYKYTDNYKIKLELPADYVVDYMPKNTQYKGDLFGFSSTYTKEKDHILLQHTFYNNHLILKKEHFKAWNDMVDVLTDTYQEVVVLKQK